MRWFQFIRAVEHFRCEPSFGAEQAKAFRVSLASHSASVVGRVLWQEATTIKIGQFHHQRIEEIENVAWCQVPVDYVVVVQMLHSFDDVAQNDIISQLM